MRSKTEICNVALRHLGTAKRIQDFDADQSAEAQACRDLYDAVLEDLLRCYNWNWATVYANLGLVQVYPNMEWPFSYRYPGDCMDFQRIWNGCHTDDQTNVVHFVFSADAQGRLILTDFGPSSALTGTNVPTNNPPIAAGDLVPVGKYVLNQPNVMLMPADFKMAFSFILAGLLAPSIPAEGAIDLREKNLQLGSMKLNQAIARDANEARPPLNLISELQKSRTGSVLKLTTTGWQAVSSNFTP